MLRRLDKFYEMLDEVAIENVIALKYN